ncbi:MAG: glycoside hydrolase family 25 protein [Oscillospiraceae bacterium]
MPKNPLIIPCIVLSLLLIASFTGNILQSSSDLRSSPPSETPQETHYAEISEPEQAPTETVQYIYIYDNGAEQREYPLLEGVALNDYNMERLTISEDKRRAMYDENGSKRTRFGIDVSAHQGFIDWDKAAADGVEFAFLRIGYRGYETGRMVEDAMFRANYEGAVNAGLDVGVYFFSQAISAEEGKEEAEFVLSVLEDAQAELTLPIVFDWEYPAEGEPARTDDTTGETMTAACIEFCKAVKESGNQPMYYATINTALFRYDLTQLTEYPLWLAEYRPETAFPYEYALWQYSSSGEVDGIDSFTDLNILFIN